MRVEEQGTTVEDVVTVGAQPNDTFVRLFLFAVKRAKRGVACVYRPIGEADVSLRKLSRRDEIHAWFPILEKKKNSRRSAPRDNFAKQGENRVSGSCYEYATAT